MNKNRVAKSLFLAAHFMIFMAAPGLSRTQNSAAPMVQPPAASRTQADPYADAFSGLTYTEEQKQAIGKIQQQIASRKAVVLQTGKLTQDQKDAMLTGYTRMEYNLIYQQLAPEQKKHVSARMRAKRASDQVAQKMQAPAQ